MVSFLRDSRSSGASPRAVCRQPNVTPFPVLAPRTRCGEIASPLQAQPAGVRLRQSPSVHCQASQLLQRAISLVPIWLLLTI